jgi:branched-chain amino acid transport system permease protein
LDIPLQAVLSQAMLGLNNGAFYALLSLGLAVIYGMLEVVNFAHGAIYMLGAFFALIGLEFLEGWTGIPGLRLGFWYALFIVPILVGLFGLAMERFLLRRLVGLEPIYGLLLTFGLALVLEGVFANFFNSAGEPYAGKPESLSGVVNLGFMMFPAYRLFSMVLSILVCLIVWLGIERTHFGAQLRAGTEKPEIAMAFGINVPLLRSVTCFLGSALAGLAGVVAAPIYSVGPHMGSEIIIVIFAVVVVGGMGSIMGAVVTGLALGVIEGLVKVMYPPLSNTVIFVVMALILLWRPAGLFGREL